MKLTIIIFFMLFCLSVSAKEFEIKHTYIYGGLKIHHLGSCEKNPSLLIEKTESGSIVTSSLSQLQDYSAMVVSLYARKCPDVDIVRVAFTPMPEIVQCKEGSECFFEFNWKKIMSDPHNKEYLKMSAQSAWGNGDNAIRMHVPDFKLDSPSAANASSQFAFRVINPGIKNANDMTEVLAAGRFDLIRGNEDENYSGLYAYYFSNFFLYYSRHCSKYIKNPKKMVRRFDTYEYNDFEKRIVEIKDENPIEFVIESDIADAYDKIYPRGMAWLAGNILSIAPNGGVDASFNLIANTDVQVERFVSGGCTEDKLLTVYNNMLALTLGKKAIKNKYSTDITLKNLKSHQPNSAPNFVAEYIKERNRRIYERTRVPEPMYLRKNISFSHINNLEELKLENAKIKMSIIQYLNHERENHFPGRTNGQASELQALIYQKIEEVDKAYADRKSKLMKK